MKNDEINVLIETHVFGKVPCNEWRYTNMGSGGGPGVMASCEHMQSEDPVGCYASDRTLPNPDYTKYIGAAWCIVDHMKSRGFYVAIGDVKSGDWLVRFKKRPYPGCEQSEGIATHTDVEKAICHAALAAFGVVYE